MTSAKSSDTIARDCLKCRGAGRIERFAGIANGVCFDCAGRGYVVTTAAAENRRTAAAARRAQKRETDRESRLVSRMVAAIDAGWTAVDWHADTCGCGGSHVEPGHEGFHESWRNARAEYERRR
ncbi:hypothetical protein SEA_DELRIO_38 [Gordonia phage DelRio]|nr:hypothetical protein SEA_DELRIO_38 [Gordonia phage DelRio]